jgi:hypothetical protein
MASVLAPEGIGPAAQSRLLYTASCIIRIHRRAWAHNIAKGTPKLRATHGKSACCYKGQSDRRAARNLVAELLAARDIADPALLLQAHHASWRNAFYRGELAAASTRRTGIGRGRWYTRAT